MNRVFDGVFSDRKGLFTRNLVPGSKVYGERLVFDAGVEYREWVFKKSKLGAAIKNGLKQLPVAPGSRVLYLGAGEGTSISHVSDIVGSTGVVVGVDIGERSMRKFVWVCEQRPNTLPVVADAHNTAAYADIVREIGGVNVLFMDVAQPDQAAIFNANGLAFFKKGDSGLLSIKAKSISQSLSAQKVFDAQLLLLKPVWDIRQTVNLAPFETDHLLVHAIKK